MQVDSQTTLAAPTEGVAKGASRNDSAWRGRFLLCGLAAIAGYVGFERVTTRANVDLIDRFESWAGNTVAIGYADSQPGFVLIGRIAADRVVVHADRQTNWLTGSHTTLEIKTPSQHTRLTLRSPKAILIDGDGRIRAVTVPWTRAEFGELLHAADCEMPCDKHAHMCGAPLEAIAATVWGWPAERTPTPVRVFLRRATD
ncbi:MAG: hypothetical protein KDA32_12470 [Phycisphaerales bacterium]|nr:hypothetical protein [Phycisphaerales bacterium]